MGATTSADELLAGLTPSQRHAVTVDAAPLCVLACAGAGKTAVLTRRIAHRALTGSLDPAHTLVISFTRKAAGELGERLTGLGLRDRVATGTFHSLAAAQLRQWWRDRRQPVPALLERKGPLVAELAGGRPGLSGVPVAELAAHLDWARARGLSPDDVEAAAAAAGRPLPAPASALGALMRRYDDEKRRRGVLDFDDLLERCSDALATDPAFASAQRWRWRHVFVDEFQDVNPLQHRLLLAWLGTGTDLCIVGDPAQAIYGWNGADPGLLDSVVDRWPSATVVRLDDNHRCTPEVVAAAAAVLGAAGSSLRSSRPSGPAVVVRAAASDAAEATTTAADVVEAHAGGLRWGQMAVLVRTNAQVQPLVAALTAAGAPVRAPGRPLADDPAVAAVVAGWRRHPQTRLQVALADLAEVLAAGRGPTGGDLDDGSAAALSALLDLGRGVERVEGPGTVARLLSALTPDAEAAGPVDAVTVCSFHRAKGLEWPAVWVCGLEAGLVPIGRAIGPAAEAEERRLLYVALTRAGRRLTCSWARTRRFGGAVVPRQPSPWLDLVAPGAASQGADGVTLVDADEWRARLSAQRARLADADPPGARPPGRRGARATLAAPDAGLVAELRAWRAGVARASGVPAHVVLHDRTLDALATLRPETADELLGVPGLGPVKAARHGATLLDLVGRATSRSA